MVTGTGTEVGKTWVAEAVIGRLRAAGRTVAVRKPAQSYSPEDQTTDADRLAAASGEPVSEVCPPHRWYPLAMAPPMAAAALGLLPPTLADLAEEVASGWPVSGTEFGLTDFGLVEGAGGVASPLALDGDTGDLAQAVGADLAILVAEAGLGTINLVRLSVKALRPLPAVVFLNRFHPGRDLHERNRCWLEGRDGLTVVTDIETLVAALT
jgi:dethiobiotin synthetase